VGEALVSLLDAKGAPGMVQQALIHPPRSRFAPLTPDERQAVIRGSLLFGHYEKVIDRESAYERLQSRSTTSGGVGQSGSGGGIPELGGPVGDLLGAFAKSAVRAIGSQVGRQIVRGVLGSIFGGGRR